MTFEECGHDNFALTRTYDVGYGNKTIWKLCKKCMMLECFCDFMIKELKN